MKFYLAAQLADVEVASTLIKKIEERGDLQCTYNWTVHGSVLGQGLARYQEIAEAEVVGVKEADVFVMLAPGGRGTHVELGIAIAREIPILLLYRTADDLNKPYPSTFHYLPQISRLHLDENETNWLPSFWIWIGTQELKGRTA